MTDTINNDVLQVQGINAKGYGTISKLVMQDRRLTPQAKGIYGYFCSYAGVGKIAFPRIDRIVTDMAISRNAYYKHFSLLKEYGYIKVDQEKNRSGQFARNVYTIMQTVPCAQNCATVNTHAQRPEIADIPVNKHAQPNTKKRYMDKRDTVEVATNNNRFENKQDFNINRESVSAPGERVYGEFMQVRMSTGQYDALVTAFGRDKAHDYIDRLDRHIASTGKQYKSHFATIRKWIHDDDSKTQDHQQRPSKNRFCNYEQRNIDFNELERMEMEYNRKEVLTNA